MALSSADLSHPVSAALDAWWAGPAASDAPAVVLGPDGVGKT